MGPTPKRRPPTPPPETPTLDRLAELLEQWDAIRDWIQWLRENGCRLEIWPESLVWGDVYQ